jgi:hypothetical protein
MCQENMVEVINIKFNKNPFSRSEVVSGVRTDGRSDFNRYPAGT